MFNWDDEKDSYGRYIKRNDDYQGSMLSQIHADLDEGQYKIMIKGYKEQIRGQFTLAIGCQGDGLFLVVSQGFRRIRRGHFKNQGTDGDQDDQKQQNTGDEKGFDGETGPVGISVEPLSHNDISRRPSEKIGCGSKE